MTPVMQQYQRIKQQNPEALLFFRLGDFYELFFEDAIVASRELELTLTGKDCGMPERAPMCGVPYHAADAYVARLIEKGFHVAICEQLSDPTESKGLVERGVTRVVTPGTLIEPSMLDEHCANYILALCLQKNRAGVAFCDVSTGEFFLYEFSQAESRLSEELARISPRELIVSDEAAYHALAKSQGYPLTKTDPDLFLHPQARNVLCNHFSDEMIDPLNRAGFRLAISAAGALLQHLCATQRNALKHVRQLEVYQPTRYMTLDRIARQNLELTESLRGRSRKGSLMGLIDQTATSMGSRLLRAWIEQPLYEREVIEARLDAVEALVNNPITREALRDAFSEVRDVERLLSRIAYEAVNARECLTLAVSLAALPQIKRLVEQLPSGILLEVLDLIVPMEDIVTLLESAISPDAPLSVKEGGIIRDGYCEELDELRLISSDGKSWISALENQEREVTGIKNLKIGYNRVFGFYIEVTKSNYDLVPMHYIRKQTLASCERFITQDLKEHEKRVLGAEDSAIRLEYRLFAEIRQTLLSALDRISQAAQALKTIDALISLAQVAADWGYVRPTINDEGKYLIKNGRHPVVEQALGRELFVPNDTHIDLGERVMIITGPNMAGKSTYMRQVALIVLLAHVGSFVPAESADIALTDRIFTRIGSSDDLYGGQSTFMVEMSEMSTILKFATPKSLMVLDEVGRGTSTFDGLSIAWSAIEYIANMDKCGARTLFSTHYHELTELEGKLEGVVNYRITAKERGEDVVFLRKIVRGGADRSFGVAVAGLAGLPTALIARARQIMARLEVDGEQKGSIGQSILSDKGGKNKQVSLTNYEATELVEEIRALDVLALSPMEALNTLFTISEKARRI